MGLKILEKDIFFWIFRGKYLVIAFLIPLAFLFQGELINAAISAVVIISLFAIYEWYLKNADEIKKYA